MLPVVATDSTDVALDSTHVPAGGAGTTAISILTVGDMKHHLADLKKSEPSEEELPRSSFK